MHHEKDSEKFGILNGVSLVMLMIMQIGYKVSIKTFSAKFLLLTTCATTWIIFTYYTSDLTARMTSGPADIPIKSFHDVKEQDFTVITMSDTSNHMFLKLSQPGSAMNSFYYDTMHENDNAYIDTIEDAINFLLNTKKVLYWDSALELAKDSRFKALIMEDSIYAHHVWAFQKNSDFTEFFNFHLHKLKESGMRDRLYSTWMYRSNKDSSTMADAISIGYENSVLPFLLFACGIIMSVVTVAFEKLKRKIKPLKSGQMHGSDVWT
jgi:hypothetical protein